MHAHQAMKSAVSGQRLMESVILSVALLALMLALAGLIGLEIAGLPIVITGLSSAYSAFIVSALLLIGWQRIGFSVLASAATLAMAWSLAGPDMGLGRSVTWAINAVSLGFGCGALAVSLRGLSRATPG